MYSYVCKSEPSAKLHMFKARIVSTESFAPGVGEGHPCPAWNVGSNTLVQCKWLSTSGERTWKSNHTKFKLLTNSSTFISVHHIYLLRYLWPFRCFSGKLVIFPWELKWWLPLICSVITPSPFWLNKNLFKLLICACLCYYFLCPSKCVSLLTLYYCNFSEASGE